MPAEWRPATCPEPNTATLINAALESYTQLIDPFTDPPCTYSCRGCHIHARPCGLAGATTQPMTHWPLWRGSAYGTLPAGG